MEAFNKNDWSGLHAYRIYSKLTLEFLKKVKVSELQYFTISFQLKICIIDRNKR